MITKLFPNKVWGAVCLGIFHLEKYGNRDLWDIPLGEMRLQVTCFCEMLKSPGMGPCLPA